MKKFSLRARVVTGAAAVALLGAGTLGAVAATAAPSPDAPAQPVAATSDAAQDLTRTESLKGLTRTTHLGIDAATKAAQAVLDAAEKAGQKVSVAVVDRNGTTLVQLRGDGAGPQSYESAARKAFTAVSWNAPTSELVKRLDQVPTLKDIPGTLFLAGGAPVRSEDAPIAGIGVAGAPSGAADEQFAQAGVHALGR